MVIFRAMLRLEKVVPPKDNVGLSQAVARAAGFDATAFERTVRHVRGEQSISPGDAASVVAGYLNGMEKLVAHLDRYGA
jgi:hypothetical protein